MTVIEDYNTAQAVGLREVCEALAGQIAAGLPGAEGKVWHGGPVWFLAGNPVVGYVVRKSGVQVLFWSGQSFGEPGLKGEGKFKAAEVVYREMAEVNAGDLARWLGKAVAIQWDYKNIVKRKGVLEKLGAW